MTNKQAQITINAIKFMLDHAQYSDDVEEALNMAISALTAKPEQSIAQERYEDLCEYFKDCSDQGRSVLNDRKEFKSWLDRMKWHVMECDKLGRELEKLSSAQPDLSSYSDKLWRNAYERGRLEAEAEQQWIPCSERLPEEGQSILVTTTNGWYVVAIIRTFFKDMHKDIIAWMPLPEPYREDKE